MANEKDEIKNGTLCAYRRVSLKIKCKTAIKTLIWNTKKRLLSDFSYNDSILSLLNLIEKTQSDSNKS